MIQKQDSEFAAKSKVSLLAKDNDSFSKKETQQRFEAALRGARIAGAKPLKEKPQAKKTKKKAASK